MGTTEEAAKGFMEAMKAQPLSLALVTMNVALLVILYQQSISNDQYASKQMELIFSSQREMQILLSKCVVPGDKAAQAFELPTYINGH